MRIHFSIFDTLLEPVFVLNVEQKVIYCNEPAATICGLSIRKITRGMSFLDLFEFNEPLEALKQLLHVCDPTPYKELSFTTPQGGEGKVQITLQPIFDQMGDKTWIVFVRDVTLEERLQKKYRAELEQKEDVIKDLEKAKLQLEDYSKNLEQMVAERTRELSRLNQTLSALLDSLGEGFFIFNREGRILDVSSKACLHTIECDPRNQQVTDVLKVPANKVDGFQKWLLTLFNEMLPFPDLAPLGPQSYPHSAGKSIALEYHPLMSEGHLEAVVVVASDITSLVEAQQQAETERESAKLIIHLMQSKKEITRFVREAEELMQSLREEISKSPNTFSQDSLFRSLHTLKGGAALFSITEMSQACHEAESLLNTFQESPNKSHFIALKNQCLQVEKSFQNFLARGRELLGDSAFAPDRPIEVSFAKLQDLLERVGKLPGGGSMAQLVLSELVMEPVGSYFKAYEDVALRLAEKQGKSLSPLELKNADIPVLPEIYSALFASLVHAFRNAVDHGIELPAEREQTGKDPQAHIRVHFDLPSIKGKSHLRLCIHDDGRGISPAAIREKLQQKGIDVSHENDEEILQHVFDSQFSTRNEVSETSGRGVGMDAIKVAALELGGHVWVESAPQKGTSLWIEVPYLTALSSILPKDSKVAA